MKKACALAKGLMTRSGQIRTSRNQRASEPFKSIRVYPHRQTLTEGVGKSKRKAAHARNRAPSAT